MPVLIGVLVQQSNYTSPTANLSRDGDVVASAFAPYDVSNDSARALVGVPVYDFQHAVPMTLTGVKSSSYYDDFYERIHVKPSLIALGNLVSAQTRTVEVWNAYTTSRLLTAVSVSNGEGIVLTQPVPTPATYAPNLALIYTLNITMNGPPKVDALFQFNFDSEQPQLSVTGSRVILFPFKTNFGGDAVESLEWKTDVLRAYDGTEQRRALRTKPRRMFNYSFMAKDGEAQLLQSVLIGWQQRVFAIPIWTDRSRVSSNVVAGASFIPCVTDTYSFTDGGLAALWQDSGNYEIVEIDTVAAGGLNLKRPVEASWPASALIYPACPATLPDRVGITRHTNTVLTGSASFLMDVEANDPYLPSASPVVTYAGFEVITIQPNWVNDLEIESVFNIDTLDFAVGVIERDSGELAPFFMRKYSWLLKSRAEIKAFRSYLLRMRGRVKTCWVPTWTDDFTLSGNSDSTHNYIRCADNQYWLLLKDNPYRKRIMIVLRSGQVLYRRITDAAADPLGQILYLDSALGVSLTPADVRAIHFLDFCRFATDKFDIQWKSDSTATIESTFQTVTPP